MGSAYSKKNFKETLKKAEKGDIASQLWVAEEYKKGNLVRRSYKKSFNWYLAAANKGVADAQLETGCFYLCGLGVKKDELKGIEWLRKAAAQDNVRAFYQIALCYKF